MNTRPLKTGRIDGVKFTIGSDNIFRDIGIPNPEEALAKADLAIKIHALIQDLGLTQTQAAKKLGTDRARISNLMRGRLREFSIERLMEYLNRLGQDIQISVVPSKRPRGHLQVVARAS
jgi:predicted XRE-type DNA-binding protein